MLWLCKTSPTTLLHNNCFHVLKLQSLSTGSKQEMKQDLMSSMKTFYPSYFMSHQMTQDLGYLDIKVFTSCPIYLNFLLFHVYFVEVCLKKQIFVQNLFHSPPSLNQPKPFVEKFEISQFPIISNSQNHPVHKRTLNHLAKLASLAKRLSVRFELRVKLQSLKIELYPKF